jgi:uncharacterized protein YacL
MPYNIEGTVVIAGETYRPGDRVSVTSTDYGTERGTFAGTLDSGSMIVVDVDGEQLVLEVVSDLQSIAKIRSVQS